MPPMNGIGIKNPEKDETGQRLKHAGDAEDEIAQRFALHDEHAEPNADSDGNQHGDQHQRKIRELLAQHIEARTGGHGE